MCVASPASSTRAGSLVGVQLVLRSVFRLCALGSRRVFVARVRTALCVCAALVRLRGALACAAPVWLCAHLCALHMCLLHCVQRSCVRLAMPTALFRAALIALCCVRRAHVLCHCLHCLCALRVFAPRICAMQLVACPALRSTLAVRVCALRL